MDTSKHNLTLEDRKILKITAVADVNAFNENEVKLILTEGRMTVLGDKLQIVGFDKRSGECTLSGNISSIKYTDKPVSAFKRFFK